MFVVTYDRIKINDQDLLNKIADILITKRDKSWFVLKKHFDLL